MDYTEYNFSAIVGAEITIVTHEGYEHVGRLVSTQLSPSDVEQLIIYLPEEDGCIVINADYVNTFTAKIKVKDMTAKQLKRFAKQEVGNDDKDAHIGMGVNVDVFYIQANFDKRQGYLFDKEYDLTDYIDCTDWGWRE